MSTIDQAFVQAFARRNRNAPPPAAAPSADDGIQVDPSVSESTQIWIDPTENKVMRADQPSPVPQPIHGATQLSATHGPVVADDVPPHVNQHAHTAYAYRPSQSPTNRVATNPVQPTPTIQDAPMQTAPIADAPAVDASPVDAPTVDVPATQTPSTDGLAEPKPAHTDSAIVHRRFDQPVSQPPSNHWAPVVDPDAAPAVAEPAPPAKEPLQPVWEVDVFDIPGSVADLFFEEKLFQLVAKRIHDAVNDGLQSLIVTSTKAGEGRSTIAIGIAMAAAASGLSVALVDGDVEDPTLADDLRLDLEFGWVEASRGGLPLDQIAIYSIEDNVTLIPMMPRQTNMNGPSITEVKKLIEDLDNQFDLVIIDGPAGDMPLIEQYATLVDSGIIAWDKSRTDLSTINELSSRLQTAGLAGVGIVENFS